MDTEILAGFTSTLDEIDNNVRPHISCFREQRSTFVDLCTAHLASLQTTDGDECIRNLESFRSRFAGILGDQFPLFANDMPLDFFEATRVEAKLTEIISKTNTARKIDFKDGEAVQRLQDDIKKRGIAERLFIVNNLSLKINGLGDGLNKLDISFAPLLKSMSPETGLRINSELLGKKLGIIALRAACCLAPVRINQDRLLGVCEDGPRTQAAKAWIHQKEKYDTWLKNHEQGIEWSSDFNNDKGTIYPEHPGEPPSKPEDADGVDRWAQGVLARHGLE